MPVSHLGKESKGEVPLLGQGPTQVWCGLLAGLEERGQVLLDRFWQRQRDKHPHGHTSFHVVASPRWSGTAYIGQTSTGVRARVPAPTPATRRSHRQGIARTGPSMSSQPATPPLQPPASAESVLTLTAPPPAQAVASTAAPRLAPAVEASALQ